MNALLLLYLEAYSAGYTNYFLKGISDEKYSITNDRRNPEADCAKDWGIRYC